MEYVLQFPVLNPVGPLCTVLVHQIQISMTCSSTDGCATTKSQFLFGYHYVVKPNNKCSFEFLAKPCNITMIGEERQEGEEKEV